MATLGITNPVSLSRRTPVSAAGIVITIALSSLYGTPDGLVAVVAAVISCSLDVVSVNFGGV